jgi:hypothetical protein
MPSWNDMRLSRGRRLFSQLPRTSQAPSGACKRESGGRIRLNGLIRPRQVDG